ncbi:MULTISPECIES: Lrp/AsnC family transcriptional regulator [Streptomyces]|uniref:Lrp/AsnC family transcriptional regulator n=1 Tax=Streptomyces vinaceusdrappus TaxID=67376 RepID=A0ABY6BLV9_9ACTN|nr:MULTISPECIES: Lrp/AsnC family transcriptional regulator [Streptomyces]RSS67184.1 Lrp/AsnC family transcriptional regulator [Streptomyces sp. WAC06273]UXI76785.1 Lrp/AsnC family transcriptional regulator [Streptomyces vinaceusdrappus]
MESLDQTALDQIDRDILALLQRDGRLTGAEVGRRVGLSQPAASARIQRLEKNGVITGYRAVVDPAALGLNIHAVVRLRTTHAQLARALDFASRTSEITSTLRVTGEDCLIFDVHCPQAGRLEEVVDALARYGPVTTSLVLRTYPGKPLAEATPSASRRKTPTPP